MPEDVARIVGAGSLETYEIAGRQCSPRPLALAELTEIERECLRIFKREYLRTYSENLDLLPEEMRGSMMLQKMDLVAKWDVHDLPVKDVVDSSKIRPTKELQVWLETYFGQKIEATSEKDLNRLIQRLAATAIDSGALDDPTYEDCTKSKIMRSKVGYVNWWITGSHEGMLTIVWVAFKPNNVTKEQIGEAIAKNPAILASLAREIEHLSGPASGNT